jgi:hypothetical protein
VYEVNQWLWQFGYDKQRLGGLSVERLMTGRRLLRRRGSCAELRLAGVARLIGIWNLALLWCHSFAMIS